MRFPVCISYPGARLAGHLAAPLAALLMIACGGSTDTNSGGTTGTGTSADHRPIDAEKFCDLSITKCKTSNESVGQCIAQFKAVRVTQACVDQLGALDCTSLQNTSTSVCF